MARIRNRRKPVAEMNVVPYIDVMLVLLVIFIVAAPLMTSRLALDLPQAEGAQAADAPAFIALALDAQGQTFLDGQALARAELGPRVRAAARGRSDLEVQLRVDRHVPYGEVAALIGVVQAAGLSRIAFVTEMPAPEPKPAPESAPANAAPEPAAPR